MAKKKLVSKVIMIVFSLSWLNPAHADPDLLGAVVDTRGYVQAKKAEVDKNGHVVLRGSDDNNAATVPRKNQDKTSISANR